MQNMGAKWFQTSNWTTVIENLNYTRVVSMAITENVGITDQVARIAVGTVSLLLVSLAFIRPRTRWAYLGLIGLASLFTGATGHCAAYSLLGINTCRNKERQHGIHGDD